MDSGAVMLWAFLGAWGGLAFIGFQKKTSPTIAVGGGFLGAVIVLIAVGFTVRDGESTQPKLINSTINATAVLSGLPLKDLKLLKSGNGRKKQMWNIDGAENSHLEIIGDNQADADNIGWSCHQYDQHGNRDSQKAETAFCHRLFVQVAGKFIDMPQAVTGKLLAKSESTGATVEYRIGDISIETDGEFYFVRKISRVDNQFRNF